MPQSTPQIDKPESTFSRFRSTIERPLIRVAAGTALLIGGLAVAGCSEVGASPSPDSSDKPSASALPTSDGGSNDGGETSAPTPTPETVTLNLKVNYDRFADAKWGSANDGEKVAACREFLDANDSATKSPEIVLSTHSTGEQGEQWFTDQMNKIYTLMGDRSDPRNQDSALKMLDCMTIKHEPSNSAYTYYKAQLDGIAAFGLEAGQPTILTSITIFSGEAFSTTDNYGSPFGALAAEGISNDLGETHMYHLYDLHADPVSGDNPMLRAAVVQDASTLTQSNEFYFGPNVMQK